MRLHNTLSGKKENLLIPADGSAIKLFVCGPTVYDYSHIGHARTYVFFDALVKFLRKHLNYKITYLQNITDVDDKIIAKAKKENKSSQEVADFFQTTYFQDMASLDVDSVDTYAPATKYIPEIISQVERLIKKGYGYATAEGNVYFDIRKFPEYGKLSHQKLSELKEGVRIETEPDKKYFADFALWKKSSPDEPSWDSPWGQGRPGWHIEDTAITEKHFGPRYHIHGGGLDLIFPHHEAEIAQMESLSGLAPLAQIWIHAGLLKIKGEKMSKSIGNIIALRDFLKDHQASLLRFIILSSHYRSELDFTPKTIAAAEAALNRIQEFRAKLKEIKSSAPIFPLNDFITDFWKELKDDFNTPQAFAVLFELIKEANKFIDNHSLSQADAQRLIDFIGQVNDIFGILPGEQTAPAEVMVLVAEREKARARGDFEQADDLRVQIEKLGWSVKDTADGPRLMKIRNSKQYLRISN